MNIIQDYSTSRSNHFDITRIVINHALEIGTGVLYLVMLLVLIGAVGAFIQGITRTGI